MKLGRKQNNTIDLIEVENGIEVNGVRTEQELYRLGYKKACEYHGNAQETQWIEYPTCLVEIEINNPNEEEEIQNE